jgi:transposase
MDNAELASEVAGMIADEIGDRWHHADGTDGMPALKDYRWGGVDSEALAHTARFMTEDGRTVTVTVSVSDA